MNSGSEQTLGIEEAAAELGVETHVLTFWEGLFPRLTPKTESGRRYYNAQDMAMLRYIRTSLIDRKLSVTVVRRRLKRWKNTKESIRSILQTPVIEDSAEDTQGIEASPPVAGATVRELRSAVSDAARSGAFAMELPGTNKVISRLSQTLDRLETLRADLDRFRSRLS